MQIESIKSGMWDSVYDACQTMGKPGFGEGVLGFGSTCCESIEIEPIVKGRIVEECVAEQNQGKLENINPAVTSIVKCLNLCLLNLVKLSALLILKMMW